MQVVVPIEMSVTLDRIAQYDPSTIDSDQSDTLDLIDEHCDKAELCNEAYKQNVTRYHNRHVHMKTFDIVSLVLRKANVSQRDKSRRKLSPN